MPITDIFTDADVKEHLKNYKKVKSFDSVKKWTHLKYFTHIEDGMYKYMMGGLLKYKYDDYVVLQNGTFTWSVQKSDTIFYQRVIVNEDILRNNIEKNNKLIKEMGGDAVDLIKENNNDIFSCLRKDKKPKKKNIKDIRDKFGLDGWGLLYENLLKRSQYIRYVDLNGTNISNESIIIDINYTKDGNIKSIKLTEEDKHYSWKIKPKKYYIFKNPNSEMKALMRRINKFYGKQ